MSRNLLVAYDGSESADNALEFGAKLARMFQPSVHVLTVARPLEFTVSVEFQSDVEQARLHCEKTLQRARTKLASESFPMHFHYVIGHPAEQIVRYAETHQVDHIVMGHRGHTRFERFLIGSVARQVIAYANCTVTVVRSAIHAA